MNERTRRKSFRALCAAFSVIYMLVMLLGSTWSWIADRGAIDNELLSEDFHTVLTEIFTPDMAWRAGSTQQKIVWVQNDSKVAGIVRVKLTESFLSFAFDNTEQNGALRTVAVETPDVIDGGDTGTWVGGRTYTAGGRHYVAEDDGSAQVNQPILIGKDVYWTGRAASPLQYVEIDFDGSLVTSVDATSTGKWYYEDGYFYWSDILPPGGSTLPLMCSIKLADNLRNRYKQALYRLEAAHESVSAAKESLAAWGIATGPVYDMLQPELLRY